MEDSQLKILKDFFKNVWKPNHYEETLIEQVNELKPRSVLDVGCGYNPYKGKIQNLYYRDIILKLKKDKFFVQEKNKLHQIMRTIPYEPMYRNLQFMVQVDV